MLFTCALSALTLLAISALLTVLPVAVLRFHVARAKRYEIRRTLRLVPPAASRGYSGHAA
jgi:hypothetical protein